MNYTDQELEEAKAFLRDRLRNEKSMTYDVEKLLAIYAAYLLTALFNDASDEDIELLIQDLIDQILEDCKTLAVDEHDRSDVILPYMLGERNGDTLEGRINTRCHTFFNEVFAVYTAGKLLDIGYQPLLKSIRDNIRHPWQNEVLVDVRERQRRGEISAEYEFDEPHFGQGVAISSFTALDTMTRYAVADAWMEWGWLDAVERGARGYFVERGSSYPCDECDSHTGIFYPITDEDSKPQYHANCCCIVIYSYVDRL